MTLQAASTEKARLFTGNFILLCLANFAGFTSFFLLLATLPVYIVKVGGSAAETGLVMGIFALTAVLLRPFVGRSTDRWGRKNFIVLGTLGLAISSILYHFTISVPSLLGLRIIHGIGWAAFSTAGATLASDIVSPSRRGEAMGYYGSSSNIAMAIGPAAGVYLMDAFSFSIVFLSSAIIALAALLFSALLRDPFKDTRPEPSPKIALLERAALFPSVIQGLSALTFGAIVTFLPLFAVQQGMGNPGLFFTVFAVVVIFGRGPLGRLSDIYGRGWVIVPSLLCMVISLGLLSQAEGIPLFLVTALLYGVGFAGVSPALMALTVDRVNSQRRGAAMGTFTASMDLGIGTGSLLWGAVAQFYGYSLMYLVASAMPLVAAFIYLLKVKSSRG